MGPVPIHDHFNGSAHCVECEGDCRLDGGERLATNLIRWIFEQWASGNYMPSYILTCEIKDAGVDMEHFRRRAKETN